MNPSKSCIVIGGGLSGLTLAHPLSTKNISVTLLEASSRLGGRIQTVIGENHAPRELGGSMVNIKNYYLTAVSEPTQYLRFESKTRAH